MCSASCNAAHTDLNMTSKYRESDSKSVLWNHSRDTLMSLADRSAQMYVRFSCLGRAAGLLEAGSPPRVERPRGSRRIRTLPGLRYTPEVCPEEEVYYPCPVSLQQTDIKSSSALFTRAVSKVHAQRKTNVTEKFSLSMRLELARKACVSGTGRLIYSSEGPKDASSRSLPGFPCF